MEFWEGAVLLVGGVWLVGHMSRRSASHPINSVATAIQASRYTSNLTNSTNMAGSTSLIAGESLTPQGPKLPTSSQPIVAPVTRRPYVPPVFHKAPIHVVGRVPVSVRPKPGQGSAPRTYSL